MRFIYLHFCSSVTILKFFDPGLQNPKSNVKIPERLSEPNNTYIFRWTSLPLPPSPGAYFAGDISQCIL